MSFFDMRRRAALPSIYNVLVLCLTFISLTLASPVLQTRGIGTQNALRILPLGDSITWGWSSSDGNGYRQDLLKLLDGNSVKYIGSQTSGNMTNNDNEGHPGWKIAEIANIAAISTPQRPNVILVMAGTNDVNGDGKVAPGAPDRFASLLDGLIAACPDAVIVAAQLTPIEAQDQDARAKTYNAALPDIVDQRTKAGKHVILVDMHSAMSTSDLADGIHPNDHGYQLMANTWFAGLQKAASNGWIGAPVQGTGRQACGGKPAWDGKYGQIASGVGSSDGPFKGGWTPVGKLATGVAPGASIRIADLDGNGLLDYIIVDKGSVSAYLNQGYNSSGPTINWVSIGQITTEIGDADGVRFADLDGDGRADLLWIDPSNGAVTAYKNNGKSYTGWNWSKIGIINSGLPGDRASIQFADIDGDGRADYHVVGNKGEVSSWLNSGPGSSPTFVSLGQTAAGIGISDQKGVHLVDLNGDKRADYCFLDKDGKMTAYINTLGTDKGLIPVWQPAGQIASGVGQSRDQIVLADLNGDNKADYLYIHADNGAIEMWLNTGSGGAFTAGEQVVFADLDGDGLDDYLSIGPNGAILAYKNGGIGSNGKDWIWLPLGTIASGVGARHSIRIADVNGDKKADYLVVDDKTGAVDLWLNGGQDKNANGGWQWNSQGRIALGICPGRQLHFADLDGDSRADYICVDDNGAATAYINGGQDQNANLKWSWSSYGTIALGVGKSGSEVRFADLNGDGKADYLVLNKINGAVDAWYNQGGKPNAWKWSEQGSIAGGVGQNGLTIKFGALAGTQRADYAAVGVGGQVRLWKNGCA